MKNIFKFVVLALISVAPAYAWPSCPGVWNQVPTGTKATGSSGQLGEIYVGDGITWQCQSNTPTPTPTPAPAPAPAPAPTPTPSTPSQTQQQNQNQSSNSSSTSSSTSGSTSSATGGASNTTVRSTNTNSATGGAGGSATSSASNNSSGNVSNYTSDSTYTEVRQNPGAYAPVAAFTTSPCSKGFSAGGSTPNVAATLGIVLTDKGCDSRQTAVVFYAIGDYEAAARVLCSTSAAKRAHLTVAQCLIRITPPAPVVVPPAPVQPPTPTVVVVPAAVPAPAPVTPPITTSTMINVGQCTLVKLQLTNVCKRMLDDAALRLESKPDAHLIISGPPEASKAVAYLRNRVSPTRLEQRFSDDQNVTLSVQFTEVQ